MREEFLQYVWQTSQFNQSGLLTTDGRRLQIVRPGILNRHSGPDFLNARIKIGNTLWAGNVEVHVYARDWTAHLHQFDPAYDNVILHVVLEEDEPARYSTGKLIPALELNGRIDNSLLEQYEQLLLNRTWIPCENEFYRSTHNIRKKWKRRLLIERLEQKSMTVERLHRSNGNDWKTTFFHWLSIGFGLKINSFAFEALAKSLSLTILEKERSELKNLEAILFGQAALIPEKDKNPYVQALQQDYLFFSRKYKLRPLKRDIWKFGRLRPANFPTIRLAQFAMLLFQEPGLLSNILDSADIQDCRELFKVGVSEYWKSHYTFCNRGSKREKKIGDNFLNLLMINVVVPFLIAYSRLQNKSELQDKALVFMQEIPPEKNGTINKWKSMGVEVLNAADSQALLQLKRHYCDYHRCLHCSIGHQLLAEDCFLAATIWSKLAC